MRRQLVRDYNNMLNLIPLEQKKRLEKEYKTRKFIMWATHVVVVLSISIVLLIPSYILSRTKAGEVMNELDHVKRVLDTELQPSEVTRELMEAAQNAQDLKPFTQTNSVYQLVKIFESKPANIRISNIIFDNEREPEPATITLTGIAADRESLRVFGRLMEARAEFATVDLPVSNFAKEKNIEFNMIITIK